MYGVHVTIIQIQIDRLFKLDHVIYDQNIAYLLTYRHVTLTSNLTVSMSLETRLILLIFSLALVTKRIVVCSNTKIVIKKANYLHINLISNIGTTYSIIFI